MGFRSYRTPAARRLPAVDRGFLQPPPWAPPLLPSGTPSGYRVLVKVWGNLRAGLGIGSGLGSGLGLGLGLGLLGLGLGLVLDSLLAHLLMQLMQREPRQQAAEGPRVRPLLGDARLPIGTRVMLVSSRVMVMIMVSARVVVGACRSSSARAASALHSASDVPAELEGA